MLRKLTFLTFNDTFPLVLSFPFSSRRAQSINLTEYDSIPLQTMILANQDLPDIS